MALSNREYYQLHALLSAERIEQLLDIEDAARNLICEGDANDGDVHKCDVDRLRDALDVVPLQ